ncbi:Homeodomain-like protein, partial [Mycena olivaceomarginata]
MMANDPRAVSPYGQSSAHAHVSPPTPPPVSPIGSDEPTVKKKRKRGDAAQLRVLNGTYARTAFPSTEERLALAKALDMSPRSVQIWFQNKRQSMRQTNRHSDSTHQSLSLSPDETILDDLDYEDGPSRPPT